MNRNRIVGVVLAIGVVGAVALMAEVSKSNQHYTEAQYEKFADACLTDAVEALDSDEKIQTWLNKCIPDRAGTNVIRRTGWAPLRSQQGPGGRPSVDAWNEKDPRMYNAYQSCLGDTTLSCEAKCKRSGADQQKICLPQCLETLHNCILNYHYSVVIEQTCPPGVHWFNPNPGNVWLPGQAVVDDRRMPHVYECLAPLANKMSYCRDCHQLTRCQAVCRNGHLEQIAGARTVQQCVAGCRKYFYESGNYRRTRKECPSGPCLPFP